MWSTRRRFSIDLCRMFGSGRPVTQFFSRLLEQSPIALPRRLNHLTASATATVRLARSAIGLGCMSIGLGDVYTSGAQDDQQAINLIHRALDLGMTLLDTANIYGDSENKVGKALKGRRDSAVLATKCGIVVGSSIHNRGVDGSPENARRSCDLSLQRLGVEHIDLYYLHRVDPAVPIRGNGGSDGGAGKGRQGSAHRTF